MTTRTSKRKYRTSAEKDREVTNGIMVSRKKPKRMFREGYDRVGGYYGRYPVGGTSRAEHKFFDTTTIAGNVSTIGNIFPSLNLLPQNVSESGRVGRKCVIKSIQWQFRLKLDFVDADTVPRIGDSFRAIVYVDHQCNGSAATTTSILETADWDSFRNLSEINRYSILMDKYYSINYITMSSDGPGLMSMAAVLYPHTWSKMNCNIPLEFSSTTGALGEIRSNNIGILVISENFAVTLEGRTRVRFADP